MTLQSGERRGMTSSILEVHLTQAFFDVTGVAPRLVNRHPRSTWRHFWRWAGYIQLRMANAVHEPPKLLDASLMQATTSSASLGTLSRTQVSKDVGSTKVEVIP